MVTKLRRNELRKNRMLIISFIIVLIVTMTPGNGKCAGNYLDKVVHFVVFLFLSISINHKYYNSPKLTGWMIWAIMLGLATEVIQQVIPGRNMDLYDGIADAFGVLAGYYLYKSKQE